MTIFNVYQTKNDGNPKLLIQTENEDEAKTKMDEMNLYFNANNISSYSFYEGVDYYDKNEMLKDT